jgi:hypothetical protein
MSGNDNDLFRDLDNELSTFMDSVMNNYSTNNANANNNTNRRDDPFSFNLNYPPRTNPSVVPPTTPNHNPNINTRSPRNVDTLMNTQYYSVLMNSIQTIRDITIGYNNNMRDYSHNISTLVSLLRVLNVQHQHNIASERQDNRRAYQQHHRQPNHGVMNIGRAERGTFHRTNSGTFTNEGTTPRGDMIGIDLLLRALNMPTDFENVVVSPSQEQIDEASEMITYTSDTSYNYSSRCPITLEDFQEGEQIRRIHHCNHVFNSTAFNNWFERNVRCPVCRFDIREHTNDNDESDIVTRQNSTESSTTTDSNVTNHINSGEEEITTSRIDLSGNRIRYIVEYEMPNSEYILYIPDASTNPLEGHINNDTE